MKTDSLKSRNPWLPVIPLTILFAVIGGFGISHHEMWLDETHHWLLAKESSSIGEMIFNARYEGHPLLWNILLFILTRFSSDPFSMQVLNLCISVIGVVLFLRYAPFSLPVKILTVFSYFIFYEYTVIARNYSLAFLLLVIVCLLFKYRHQKFFLFSVFLVLFAQTHLFATAISCGIFLFVLYEKYASRNNDEQVEKSKAGFFAGILLVLASIVFVVYQSMPPADHFLYSYNSDSLTSFKRIGKGASVLWKGFFPLPDFGSDYPWNSNLVVNFSKNLAIIPVTIAWFLPAFLFCRRRKLLFFFYATAFVLAAFMFVSPLIVASRHCGFFFLLLIASLWMAEYLPEDAVSQNKLWEKFKNASAKIAGPLFIFILVIQEISGIYMHVVDWNRPFSNAKAVTEWISTNRNKNEMIVVSDHSSGPAVCAYLGRDVYYPENNSMGNFCKWNTKPFVISRDTLLARLSRLLDKNPDQPILLVRNRNSMGNMQGHFRTYNFSCEELKTFPGALVKAEDYTIYEIKRP